MSSPIIQYSFNTSSLGTDSSGSSLDATNTDVTLVTDAERGPVASFNGSTSVITLPSASLPSNFTGNNNRTYMFWAKHTGVNLRFSFMYNGTNGAGTRFMLNSETETDLFTLDISGVNNTGSSLAVDTWYHLACTYNGSSFIGYVNGVQDNIINSSINTGASDLLIGNNPLAPVTAYAGLMSDFRGYNTALSAADILAVYNIPVVLYTVTPWSTLMTSSWSATSGATSYRVTVDDGSEEIDVETTSLLESVIYNLTPEVSYTIRLYSSSDDITYVFDRQDTQSTLQDLSTNVNIEIFNTGPFYDFSILNNTTRDILTAHLNDVLTVGSSLLINIENVKENIFRLVPDGSTFTIPDGESVILALDENSGSGQSVSLVLSDSSTEVITYDELANSIMIDGTSRAIGDVFILDGKKVTVYDL